MIVNSSFNSLFRDSLRKDFIEAYDIRETLDPEVILMAVAMLRLMTQDLDFSRKDEKKFRKEFIHHLTYSTL